MERKKLFEVSGVSVYEDSRFLIGSKKDDIVFEGMKQLDTVKFKGTPISCSAPFFINNPSNPNSGFYDLGFEEDSEHYKYLQDFEAKDKVKEVVKNIVDPYLKRHKYFINKDTGKQEPLTKAIFYNGDSFYDQLNISVTDGDVLLASKIEDRFKIYILLLKKAVCPIELQHSSEFAKSSLTITDLVSKVKKSQTKSDSIFEATYHANKLLVEDRKDQLVDKLTYIGLKHFLTEESDKSQFRDYIQNNVVTRDSYREAFIDSFNNKTEEEIKLYSILQRALKKSSIPFMKQGNVYYYSENELGSDLKLIAKTLSEGKTEGSRDIVKNLLADS